MLFAILTTPPSMTAPAMTQMQALILLNLIFFIIGLIAGKSWGENLGRLKTMREMRKTNRRETQQ